MPLQDHMHIVSVDDHLIEHPRVWLDRLPKKHQEAGPQIIERGGHQMWQYAGTAIPYIGLNAVAGKEPKDFGMEPVRYDDMIPGCYDPKARVQDMDVDGAQAACCFPSFPGFAGSTLAKAEDKELALLCIQAWNDFNLEEWYGYAPDRFIPLALVPYWDAELSAAEVRRVAALGARGITFPESPVPLGLPSFHSDYWEPLWIACAETDTPVSLHFGSSGFVPSFGLSGLSTDDLSSGGLQDDAPFAVAIALFATNLQWTVTDLMFCGALQRHPNLKFVLAEGGVGWIPYCKERADYVWERHRWYQKIDFDQRPSELFDKHFWGCFIDDQFGVDVRQHIGINRLTLEVDYPHSDSLWPNSRKHATEVFADVPDDEVHRIVELNARELYRFPRS
jgi:predicted TIM-barrel fold metal-dependent hydrolase